MADTLGLVQKYSPLISSGLEIGKDLLSQHLRDKIIKPARNRYLETLHGNEGYSGYSKAQTDSMRRARELARGTIAMAAGKQMATGASLGQRLNEMAQIGEHASNTDFYDLNTGLQNAENAGRGKQVGIAEGNAGRQMESLNHMGSLLGDAAKNILNVAGAKSAEKGGYSTPTMDPGPSSSGTKKTAAEVQTSAFDDAMKDRIRSGTASDSDMETAFKAGYMGGPKTQAYYKSKGWI